MGTALSRDRSFPAHHGIESSNTASGGFGHGPVWRALHVRLGAVSQWHIMIVEEEGEMEKLNRYTSP